MSISHWGLFPGSMMFAAVPGDASIWSPCGFDEFPEYIGLPGGSCGFSTSLRGFHPPGSADRIGVPRAED